MTGKMTKSPLQKVLNWRRGVVRSRTVALSNSQSELEKQEQILQVMRQNKASLLDIRDDGDGESTISLARLQVALDYMLQLNEAIAQQRDTIGEAAKKVDSDRDALLEAAKEKKVVEKLRDNKLADEMHEVRKKQRKLESETALRMVTKRTVTGIER